MSTVVVSFEVFGSSFSDILDKTRHSLAEFFEVNIDEVDEKIKYEMHVSDTTSSFLDIDLEEEPYAAQITAKVRIDDWK